MENNFSSKEIKVVQIHTSAMTLNYLGLVTAVSSKSRTPDFQSEKEGALPSMATNG